MKWKSLFAAALSAAVALPALAQDATGGGIPFTNGRSISVNFATGQRNVTNNVSGDARFGLANVAVAGSQWDNITGTSAADQALKVSGATSGAKLTFRAGATWSVNDPSTALGNTNALLGSFLDDGTAIIVGEDSSTFAAEITVANIPFEHYDVYLYSNVNNGSGFKPIQVNGTYYTYANGATVSTEDTSAQWGATAQTTPQLGRNVLVVSDVTGDALTIRTLKRIMQGNGTNNIPRGSFAGFQIVCTDEIVKQTADVMSLNFATGNDKGTVTYKVSDQTGEFGLVPVPAAEWVDLETKANTEGVAIADTGATVTWSAKNTWNNANATDPLRKAYLDDGKTSENVGASVTVANVPYSMYDVIVYYSNDAGYAFKPVTVNGYSYTWDKTARRTAPSQAPDAIDDPVQGTADEAYVFGTVDTSAPELGKNALRVTAQDAATLTVQGEDTYIEGENTPKTARGGIAALQVVERKVIDVTAANTDLTAMLGWYAEGTPLYIRVAAGGTVAGDVTLPADAILDLSAYTFGNTLPITGTLTMDGGTIRLPDGFESGKIAASISGSFTCFIGDELVWLSNQDGTLSLSYEWWGLGGDDLWSNPLNWSSGRVPNENAEVSFNLGASDEIVILDKAATVASVTITGSESSAATLEIQAQGGGSLAVSGQMATSGNVTVTQNANITVNGKSTMVFPSEAPQTYPYPGAFHVEGAGAKYNVEGGTLSVPTVPEMASGTDIEKTAGGFVTVCGGASLSVGGGDAEAVLSVYRCSMSWPSGDVSRDGRVTVRPSGVLEVAYQSNFASGLTLVTEGGTIRAKSGSVTVSYRGGYAPTSPLTLSAPEGATLTLSAQSSTNALLTGNAPVIIDGPGTVAFVGTIDPATYTGEISVTEGTLSIGERRPKLSVVSGTTVLITPTTDELAEGSISFGTSMAADPNNVTFTVDGVEAVNPVVENGQLTLAWEVSLPTISATTSWNTADSWSTGSVPTSGTVVLDGTAEGGITVKLDTAIPEEITSIILRGDVTLVTSEAQSTIPACVTPAEGAVLTIGANISGASLQSPWELPAGTTLQVTEDFTSFANLTLEGAVVILKEASGTLGEPNIIEAPLPVEFNGGLTIKASNLTLESVYNVGKTLELAGDNITIAGNRFFTDTGTQVVNTGTGNVITGITGLNGSLAVEGGTLALTLGAKPNKTYFSGATIAGNATLTLAAEPDSSTGVTTARGWFFSATGDGTLEIEVGDSDFRPNFSTLPKKMVFTATAAEQADGVIECKAESGLTLPADFTVTVHPAGDGGAWAPNAVLESGGNAYYLRIYNKLPANLPVGVEDAIAKGIQQDATTAGITKGYTVQLTTKGQPVEVTADMLNDVLGCFTGLTATASADKATLTYAYDFGIVGIARNAENNGWVVTAKVQGAAGAKAGFAAGNAYTLTVNGTEVSVAGATVDEGGTVTLPLADTEVQGDGPLTLGVKVSRPAAQP